MRSILPEAAAIVSLNKSTNQDTSKNDLMICSSKRPDKWLHFI